MTYQESFADPEVDNINVDQIQAVIQPQLLMQEYPSTEAGRQTVLTAREAVRKVLDGQSDKLIVVVGPCSIHDRHLAEEYGRLLVEAMPRYSSELVILMRVYFEKPRTTVGWKGLISDPYLDDSCQINQGLRLARSILVDLNDSGVPVAVEFLDTMVPQYLADQVSWGAIGARTVESQLHRQLAAGLSMPVGFKNGTSGDLQVAVDACRAANHPQTFLGITKQGVPGIVHSRGNKHAHVILRGGKTGPNFDSAHVNEASSMMQKVGLIPRVVVDVSHGNSNKDFRNQPKVCKVVGDQIRSGSLAVAGVMIESHINEGAQSLPAPEVMRAARATYESDQRRGEAPCGRKACWTEGVLKHGVSITDACVDWATTERMLDDLAEAVRQRRTLIAAEADHITN